MDPGSSFKSLDQSLSNTSEAASRASILGFVCQIKFNSQLLGCAFSINSGVPGGDGHRDIWALVHL